MAIIETLQITLMKRWDPPSNTGGFHPHNAVTCLSLYLNDNFPKKFIQTYGIILLTKKEKVQTTTLKDEALKKTGAMLNKKGIDQKKKDMG